jgi:hypothetical protein
LRGDRARFVQHVRDGADRNAGALGDLLHLNSHITISDRELKPPRAEDAAARASRSNVTRRPKTAARSTGNEPAPLIRFDG